MKSVAWIAYAIATNEIETRQSVISVEERLIQWCEVNATSP
ncbi:MAG TPA: hypothetical protein VFH01_13915 [Pyrinomonadaceae bacterium]|nr:hypothetical protein [Pyrinomonadaceae bacterium]